MHSLACLLVSNSILHRIRKMGMGVRRIKGQERFRVFGVPAMGRSPLGLVCLCPLLLPFLLCLHPRIMRHSGKEEGVFEHQSNWNSKASGKIRIVGFCEWTSVAESRWVLAFRESFLEWPPPHPNPGNWGEVIQGLEKKVGVFPIYDALAQYFHQCWWVLAG